VRTFPNKAREECKRTDSFGQNFNVNYVFLDQLLENRKKIVITTHKSPDGDAIGSSLGLAGVLQKSGHQVNVIIPDAAPGFLGWMKGADMLLDSEQDFDQAQGLISDAEVLFALDYNRLDRTGLLAAPFAQASGVKVMIDHHIDPSDEFDVVLSDVTASSTAELVFRFLSELNLKQHIDADLAACLYAGIMTDTGSFKFSSTSAETHRIAAELIDMGLVPDRVHSAIFDTSSYDRLQLIGHALSKKLDYDFKTGVSVIALSLAEKNRFKYQKGDTEGLVNYGLAIEGSRMSIFLSEELNMTKCSLRSKGEVDVNLIARAHFNGGGHKNAAGGRLDMKLPEAIKYVKDVVANKIHL
jgi:phosphoesterase RecJ-like protein